MAAGAVGDIGPAGNLAVALLGGGVAAASHAAKAGTRVLINTSPEPFTNWTASVTEDLGVLGGLLIAIKHPAVFLVLLAIFFILLVWLLPKLWRGIKGVFGAIGRFFGGSSRDAPKETPRLESMRRSADLPGPEGDGAAEPRSGEEPATRAGVAGDERPGKV
jgi:CBS domain containing-hemolysin-like protein